MKNNLSHRERVMLALDHKDTDRIPISMVCSGIHPPTIVEFDTLVRKEKGIGAGEYLKSILDIVMVFPKYIGPPLEKRTDHFGVRRKRIEFGIGSYEDEIEYYPLADAETIDDVLKHNWPSPDWFDYSGIPEKIKKVNKDEDFCIISGWGIFWEATYFMRGFEQCLMDLLLNPELLSCIMGKVAEFQFEFHRRILEAGDGEIDLIFTADDIGSQRDLLVSLDTWEKNIKPYHVQLNEIIHSFNAKAIYHTDGAVMKAVPGLIDMGIDILQALQFDAAGMDPMALKDGFGDRLCFEGGISVQKTLPSGTMDDVRDEVREYIRVLGKNGGYILGPSHAVQAGTPAENVYTMFETALETKL